MADPQNSSNAKAVSRNLFDVNSSDPNSELIDRSQLSSADIGQINRLMAALSALRQKEKQVTEASERYMKLSSADMQAIRFLIVYGNRNEVVTPGMLGSYLDMSPASITKLLNRLEKGGHIIRKVHPVDRRAFAIEVTAKTRTTAMQTVGKHNAKRFNAAARLSPAEREVVIGFLEDMSSELSLDDAEWANGS